MDTIAAVLAELTVDSHNNVCRKGQATGWTIVRRGVAKYRAIHRDGGLVDDRNSDSVKTELALLAERIAADECDQPQIRWTVYPADGSAAAKRLRDRRFTSRRAAEVAAEEAAQETGEAVHVEEHLVGGSTLESFEVNPRD